jgi:hypothetical protein
MGCCERKTASVTMLSTVGETSTSASRGRAALAARALFVFAACDTATPRASTDVVALHALQCVVEWLGINESVRTGAAPRAAGGAVGFAEASAKQSGIARDGFWL